MKYFLLILFSLGVISSGVAQSWEDSFNKMIENYTGKEYTKSIENGLETIAILEKNKQLDSNYVNSLFYIEYAYFYLHDYENAVNYAKKENYHRKKITPQDDLFYFNSIYTLAIFATYTSDYETSIDAFKETLLIMENTDKRYTTDYVSIENQLAGIYELAGSHFKAQKLYEKNYETAKKLYSQEDSIFQVMTNTLSSLYISHGVYDKAEPFFLASLSMMEQMFGKNSENYILVLNSLGEFYLYAGWYKKCEKTYQEFVTLCKGFYGNKSADYATSLNNLAVAFEKQGEFTKAEKLYFESLKIKKKVYKKESDFYALTITNLGVLYDAMGEREKSEELFNEAIEIYKGLHGKSSENYAIALSSMAAVQSGAWNFEKAEELFIKALEIQKNLYGESYPAYITSLSNLGQHHTEMGKFDLAEKELEKACELCKNGQGEAHTNYASSLHILANLKATLGKTKEAENLLLKALEISFNANGKYNSTYNNILGSLATVNMTLGKYQKAEQAFMESIAISEKTRGKLHPEHAILLNNIGLFYLNIGSLKKAEENALKALKILYDSYGENDPNIIYPSTVLANIYKEQEKYQLAEKYVLSASNIALNSYGENHPNYVNVMNNLAVFYYELGNYEKAEELYLVVIEKNKLIYGDTHTEYSNSLNNLGALYMSKILFATSSEEAEQLAVKSEKCYNQVLQIDSSTIGVQHTDFATHLNNIAELYRLVGRYSDSEKHFTESLRIQDSIYGKNHINLGVTYNNMGLLYENIQNWQKAIVYYEKSIAVKELNYGNKSNSLSSSYINLASLLGKTCNTEEAYTYFQKAFKIDQYNIDLNFSFLSENEKVNYQKNTSYYSDLFNSFCIEGKETLPEVTTLLYNNELWKKGLILKSSNRMKSEILNSKDATLISQYDKWTDLKQEIAMLCSRPLSSRESPLAALEAEVNQLEKILITSTSLKKRQNQSFDWKSVKRSLQKGEAAIEFCDFYKQDSLKEHIYCALIVHSKIESPIMVELCSQYQIEEIIGKYGGNNYTHINSIYGKQNKLNNSLYELIWKPLEKYLEEIETIYFSPSGILNKLSFNAISKNASTYLSDIHALNQVNSTAQIHHPEEKNFSIGLFGGAQYTTNDNSTEVWKYLEGTKTEVIQINKLFSEYKYPSEIFINKDASEDNFKAYNNNSPTILHIATHGFFYPDLDEYRKDELANTIETDVTFRSGSIGYKAFVNNKNPLMRSGIVFTGANNVWNDGKISGEDGILTAYEVANMNLSNTEIVVLSACETGLGEIRGSEGVYGLQRAFKAAGVRELIITLWQVPDNETEEFMTYFYKQLLKTKNSHKAFLVTQQMMKKKYDPYYWAAFVLVE